MVKYRILCFLLFIVILLLGAKIYEIWTQPVDILPEKSVARKPLVKTEPIQTLGTSPSKPSAEPIALISDKNIFHPERKDFPIPMTAGGPSKKIEKPPSRPQLILYGTTFAGDYQSALVAHTGRPLQKGERETMVLKLGDRIGEYSLKKIIPDRIVMEGGEDSFEVLLDDAKIPKKRSSVKTENKPATITSLVSTLVTAPVTAELPKPSPPRETPPERVVTPTPAPTRPAPTVSPTPEAPPPSTQVPIRGRRTIPMPGTSGITQPERSATEGGP